MSFDIFFQRFEKGEPVSIDRAAFQAAFSGSGPRAGSLNGIAFPDGSAAEIYGAGGDEEIDGLMFNHCGGDSFFKALYTLATNPGSVVFWPDTGPSIAITSVETLEHIPESMIEALGKPFIVQNAEELEDAIFGQIDPVDSENTDD